MDFLPKFPHNFLIWWAVSAPKRLFTIVRRIIVLVNSTISFTLNIRLIFTPLFGDYSIPGRFIGFTVRIFEIIGGLVFVGILSVVAILLPLAWWVAPIILFQLIGLREIPLILVLYFVWATFSSKHPRKRISEVTEEVCDAAFRPEVVNLANECRNSSSDGLRSLLNFPEVKYLLRKCELLNDAFYNKLAEAPLYDAKNISIEAFNIAKNQRTRYVEIEHLFMAALFGIPKIEVILQTFGSKKELVERTCEWIITEREKLSKIYIWQEDYEMMFTGGTGKGMTGRITPFLDSISQDFTKLVQKGYIQKPVGREEEMKRIADLLTGSKSNILVIGPSGSGKTTLVKGMAYKIIEGTEYKALKNRRIVNLEIGGLVSGTRSTGDIAYKVNKAMDEIRGSGDIILFIDEIHNLVAGSGDSDAETSSVYSMLEPILSGNEVQCIGATSLQNYRKYIEPNEAFSRLFTVLEIKETNKEDSVEILKSKSNEIEFKRKVMITYPALVRTIELSERLIHERVLPDKALDILNRTVTRVAEASKYVTAEEVAKEISDMTHIPVDNITQNEAEKLLNIENEMKNMVVGQDKAIYQIGAALKRARVGIRDENKPIASFLFIGTTGVGKTQTAKALAKSYFGNSKNMIRLDMSEYQQIESIERLVGTHDGKVKGYLTESIRTKPFSLLLLDEIEKAHPNILLTFLQVLDDARLTDGSGDVADFTNSIIIATSNVGTRVIQEIFGRNGTFAEMQDAAMREVREKFAPEFLNRFTGIIVFNPLSTEDIKKIADLLLNNVRKLADTKGIKVNFTDTLIEEIIKRGYNPQWGARPLARVIEDSVESHLAVQILSNKLKQGDEITLDPSIFNDTQAA